MGEWKLNQAFAFGGEEVMENFDASIKYRASIQNYLIDTGDEIILVDTGIPDGLAIPEPDDSTPIYNGELISSYVEALQNLGYDVKDVSKILLTHKHLPSTCSVPGAE